MTEPYELAKLGLPVRVDGAASGCGVRSHCEVSTLTRPSHYTRLSVRYLGQVASWTGWKHLRRAPDIDG